MFRPVLISLALLGAAPACAELVVCNRADGDRSLAIARVDAAGVAIAEGWWTVPRGACRTVLAQVPQTGLFYHAAGGEEAFDGPALYCTGEDSFFVRGDVDCEDRGLDRARFRPIETGGAERITLELDAEDAGSAPAMAAAPPSLRAVASGVPQGTYGEPFTMTGLFTGCASDEGLDFCGFVAEGWRWRAYHGTTDALVLDEIAKWPVNTPVRFDGDILNQGDITVEVALTRVEGVPDGDPFAALRAGLQGRWQAVEDPALELRIAGAEVAAWHEGQMRGRDLMRLLPFCEGGEPDAPGLHLTALDSREVRCMTIRSVDPDELRLVVPGTYEQHIWRRVR